MNKRRRNWIITTIVVAILVIGYAVARMSLSCCALPPTPPTQTVLAIRATASVIVSLNNTTEDLLHETETNTFQGGFAFTITPTPSPLPYDATLYAQRQLEELMLRTGAGPTEYARFFATETALVATYQGTVLTTFTPIHYDASMSPTAIPRFDTSTPTPTLCPPSDVVCPGGNETLSPQQQVYQLMASAEGTEYAELALTATALATSPTPTEHSITSLTPTPTSNAHDSNCAFSWAHQDLPDAARAVQTALNDAGVKAISVLHAEAFGENCNRADGSLSYFGAMSSDFYLAATVKTLDDADEMGQIIKTAYNTITTLKVKLPAGPGYLDIVFSAGGQFKRFRTMFYTLKPLIDAGKKWH